MIPLAGWRDLQRDRHRIRGGVGAGGDRIAGPEGEGRAVISIPCLERFMAQPQAVRDAVLSPASYGGGGGDARAEVVGLTGVDGWVIGIDRFGASAPEKALAGIWLHPNQGRGEARGLAGRHEVAARQRSRERRKKGSALGAEPFVIFRCSAKGTPGRLPRHHRGSERLGLLGSGCVHTGRGSSVRPLQAS